MTRLLNGAARSDILKVGGCHDIIVRNSPWSGYSVNGMLRFRHFILGAVVAILTVLEFREGWTLTNEELAEHDK